MWCEPVLALMIRPVRLVSVSSNSKTRKRDVVVDDNDVQYMLPFPLAGGHIQLWEMVVEYAFGY
jgi:hypothetical protein